MTFVSSPTSDSLTTSLLPPEEAIYTVRPAHRTKRVLLVLVVLGVSLHAITSTLLSRDDHHMDNVDDWLIREEPAIDEMNDDDTHALQEAQGNPASIEPLKEPTFSLGTPTLTPLTSDSQPPVVRMYDVMDKVSGLRIRHDRFDATVSRERSVVIALHDRIVPLGLSLIKDLRCLGNTDLIQVYHCFPHELSPGSRELLVINETRLEIVDVCTEYIQMGTFTEGVATKFRNWWIKPLALYHTDVREVLLLDADVVPQQDPAVLRTLPGYQMTGTIFFYDRVIPLTFFLNANMDGVQLLRHWLHTFDYGAFNLTGPAPSSHLLHSLAYRRLSAHEMDSSMVAIDKARAGKAMDVLWFLITKERFKYDFSWGDKESYWLAYELAHVDYFFSPWAASVVSTNQDIQDHPNTLCGSLAHYLPIDDETPQLLYINGKALVEPYPNGVDAVRETPINQLFNMQPTHVTPRHVRQDQVHTTQTYFMECLVELGSTPLPVSFARLLLRRRTFYLGIVMGIYSELEHCALV